MSNCQLICGEKIVNTALGDFHMLLCEQNFNSSWIKLLLATFPITVYGVVFLLDVSVNKYLG